MRSTFLGGIVVALFTIVGCEYKAPSEDTIGSSVDEALAEAQLNSLSYDFRLWDILTTQDIANPEVSAHVANSIVRHLVLLGAMDYEVADLQARSIEALCRATTEEVRNFIEEHGHADLGAVALDYVDQIRPTVLDEVQRIQGSLLGKGCLLSPR